MIDLTPILDRRYEHIVLAVMLLALYLALRSDVGSGVSASLMAVHLGLFFIWQPIWQRDEKLDFGSVVLVIAFSALFVAGLNWWFVFVWLILLIGIVAGRTIGSFAERVTYMMTLAYLVSELLVTCVVNLFSVRNLASGAVELYGYGLAALPCVLPLMPMRRGAQQRVFAVDFVRSINFALMTALLAVSSVALTDQTRLDYPVALFLSLLTLAGFLLLIGWLLSPRAGAGSLFQLWERSLLNIGTPFELWLTRLAQAAERAPDPEAFLGTAAAQLVEIPFVAGAEWRSRQSSGRAGEEARYKFDLDAPEVALSVYTQRSVGPTLLLHYRLLMQLVAHFYAARLRAHDQAHQAHLQAIYETGARLTHDIKNLLQSLNTLTGEIQRVPEGASEFDQAERRRQGEALLRRQLPHISQRLQLALAKLQVPVDTSGVSASLRAWWAKLQERVSDPRVRFEDAIEADREIPVECFDSVVDNLIDNALYKAKIEPDLRITVRAFASAQRIELLVSDSGSAISPKLSAELFKQTITSTSGLGIGLYQAARQAENVGYRLSLASNEPGQVCFALARPELAQTADSMSANR